jgi:hypothetical protein
MRPSAQGCRSSHREGLFWDDIMTMSVHAEIEISAQVIEFRMKRR